MGRIDTVVARYAAKYLPKQDFPEAERLRAQADALARAGCLILIAHIPANLQRPVEQEATHWLNSIIQLYSAFSSRLFDTLSHWHMEYVDAEQPLMVVAEAEATLVTDQLGRWLLPYVAWCQRTGSYSPYEAEGLLNSVLRNLLAEELSVAEQAQIRQEAHDALTALIRSPLGFHVLTSFKDPSLFPLPKTGSLSSAPPPPQTLKPLSAPPSAPPPPQNLRGTGSFTATVPTPPEWGGGSMGGGDKDKPAPFMPVPPLPKKPQ